jgi:hypothetical protein
MFPDFHVLKVGAFVHYSRLAPESHGTKSHRMDRVSLVSETACGSRAPGRCGRCLRGVSACPPASHDVPRKPPGSHLPVAAGHNTQNIHGCVAPTPSLSTTASSAAHLCSYSPVANVPFVRRACRVLSDVDARPAPAAAMGLPLCLGSRTHVGG